MKNYDELSREDIIDLILTLEEEKCIDVFYNVAYGITNLLFGPRCEIMEKGIKKKKNFNGPLHYDELSREDIIDLILTLKEEKCIDVFYNVAYGITNLLFGQQREIMEKSDK